MEGRGWGMTSPAMPPMILVITEYYTICHYIWLRIISAHRGQAHTHTRTHTHAHTRTTILPPHNSILMSHHMSYWRRSTHTLCLTTVHFSGCTLQQGYLGGVCPMTTSGCCFNRVVGIVEQSNSGGVCVACT